MLRIIGALMTAIPFISIGLIKSLNLNLRARQANLAYNFFLEIKEAIRYTGAETDSIIEQLLIRPEYTSLNKEFSALKKQDSEMLQKALLGIGKTDTYGQLKYIDSILQRLKGIINSAEKDCNEKAKLYRMLGVCAGVAVAIIIM